MPDLVRIVFVACLVTFTQNIHAQVNAYAQVTSFSGTTINVTNVNESFDTFESGEQVLIMQMQDSVIGESTNISTFGSMGSILSAGLFEIRVISNITESGGIPTSIDISGSLSNTYNTGANTSVQIISFPTLDDGGGDFTTTSNITAVDWDGNVGGIVAFNVDSTLTLNHDISANESGFIGGSMNGGSSVGCTPNGNYRVGTQDNHANKGEGIFNPTSAFFAAGRGRILNGGGGGNSHNAGGAGGGNFTAGGDGGPGWVCNPVAGGLGGLSLSADISASRVFMGGGGGAGEGNNGLSTPGGDGGGIILIKANELVTTGTCAGRTISANGEDITSNSGNDGSGGGGAGGSIIFQVNKFNVVSGCTLTNEASGGDGGSVNNGAQHGGGGGGGQGVIIYSIAQPVSNITTITDNGNGGCNNNSNPCTNQASSASGSSGTGIIGSSSGPLPVTWLEFNAYKVDDKVQLQWMTASEINNDYFQIQRSFNILDWEIIGSIEGKGNSTHLQSYDFVDNQPLFGTSYYRIKQVDFNGNFDFSKTVAVNSELDKSQLNVFPLPVTNRLFIQFDSIPKDPVQVTISNIHGQEIIEKEYILDDHSNTISIDVNELRNGMYLLLIYNQKVKEKIKIIKN